MNDLSEYADENAILVLVGNQIDKPDQYDWNSNFQIIT